jgi:hypothetical protein
MLANSGSSLTCRAAPGRWFPKWWTLNYAGNFVRAGKTRSVARLNAFVSAEPDRLILLNRTAMLYAADLWAQARRQGLSTADPKELDVDVLQAAQLLTAGIDPAELAVATTNVGHLARFLKADLWSNL